ncbi:hypothetical protein ACFX15_018458 [Malus domestica]
MWKQSALRFDSPDCPCRKSKHFNVDGGEQRRISIEIDMIHDPIILFLDELTSYLDSTSAFMVVTKPPPPPPLSCPEISSTAMTSPMGSDPPISALTSVKNPSSNILYDEYNHERYPLGDPSKRAFAYFVLTRGRFALASLIRLPILKFVLSMSASKDVLSMASLEVDLSNIELGSTVIVKWRGKPVFIRRRTDDDIKLVNSVDINSLRDPQQDVERVKNPEGLIVVGICTHLGRIPSFCPCHGSHYDILGRIRKGLAPYNLEVHASTGGLMTSKEVVVELMSDDLRKCFLQMDNSAETET